MALATHTDHGSTANGAPLAGDDSLPLMLPSPSLQPSPSAGVPQLRPPLEEERPTTPMMMPSHDSATGRSAQAGRPCRVQFAQAAEVFDVERLAFSDLRGDTRDVTGTGNDPDWWSMGAARSRRLAEFADTFWLRKGFCIWSFATAEAVCMRWGEEQEEAGRPGADAHPAAGAAQTDEAVCANVGEGREPSGVGAPPAAQAPAAQSPHHLQAPHLRRPALDEQGPPLRLDVPSTDAVQPYYLRALFDTSSSPFLGRTREPDTAACMP